MTKTPAPTLELDGKQYAIDSLNDQAKAQIGNIRVIEQEIARLAIERRIVLDIPNFLGAAFIVEHTDLLMTVPRRLGELLRGRGEFSVLPVPFPLPEYTVKQHWHVRFHHDPGNRWLRGVIAGLVSESTN